MNTVALSPKPATPCTTVFNYESGHEAEAAVIVPVLNGAGFLSESLESACRQVDVPLEIIVIDDDSRDGTAATAVAILENHQEHLARALVVRHAFTAGPAAARDTGMRHTKSPAALLLDADNIIYPRCVRRCLDALESSGAAFVYPIVRTFGEKSGLLGTAHYNKERLGLGNYIDTLALVRRSAWEMAGGFPDLPEGLEDYAFWLRLADLGLAGAQVPEILAAYRTHRSSRTQSALSQLETIHRRLKTAFPWITVPPQIAQMDTDAMSHTTGDESRMYIDLLIRILANTIYEDASTHPDLPDAFDAEARAAGRDWPSLAHSMAGVARLKNVADLVQRTLDEKIPGDYIETGVWRGGCCILMRAILAAKAVTDRKVFAADSFAGLPAPNPQLFPADTGDTHSVHAELAVSLDEVKANFRRYGLLDDCTVFVEGLFRDTLPALKAGPFALIRLDGDMYESTFVALENLYPRLSEGGFVIIDDFGAVPGCRKAVEEYRAAHGITEPIHEIDWTGVWWQKTRPNGIAPGVSVTPNESRAEQLALQDTFTSQCAQRGLKPDPLFFWYHTIDLGEGVITPGSFDYRATLPQFDFPANMSGMTALDVGSASGFFAFEMERRGASVTSTELPSLSCWDRFPGESPSGIVEKIRKRLPYHSTLPIEEITRTFRAMSEKDLHHILLDGPFRFCQQALGSNVRRVYTTIYDLERNLGPETQFDLVLLSDVLVHTVDPLNALAAAAGRCKGRLVIADEIVGSPNDPPALHYIGGNVADSDIAEWWRPNHGWIRMVLSRLGFGTVETISTVTGYVRPGGEAYRKQVIHAKRK